MLTGVCLGWSRIGMYFRAPYIREVTSNPEPELEARWASVET